MKILRNRLSDEIAPFMHLLFLSVCLVLEYSLSISEWKIYLFITLAAVILTIDTYYFINNNLLLNELYFVLRTISTILCFCILFFCFYDYMSFYGIITWKINVLTNATVVAFFYLFRKRLILNKKNIEELYKKGKVNLKENLFNLEVGFYEPLKKQRKNYNLIIPLLVISSIINSSVFQGLFNPIYFKLTMCSLLLPLITVVFYAQLFESVFYFFIIKPSILRKGFFL